jgi:aminoglycoside phosphotransferase (APT) family kinase protein
MHAGQVDVSVETVTRLVAEQFPEWSALRIASVSSAGTVNAIFRLGDDLCARFPLVAEDVVTVRQRLEAEEQAARALAGRTRFSTPEPVAMGEPDADYPMPWLVQTWIPGRDATVDDPGASFRFAEDLAEFIAAVRGIDTRGRPFAGTGRGGDLHAHTAWMETCFTQSAGLLDVPRLRALWTRLRDLPRSGGPDLMTHGDLIPGNVLVKGGRLTGVLDVGGLGPADPALDLVCAWHLLDREPRKTLRQALDCDDLEWARGQAWAFEQAMGVVWYYATSNPTMSDMGRRTLDRILREPV